MTDHLRNRIAKALEREDVLNCGYDHSFASTYGVDPETDGFVDAVLATLLDGAEREPRIPLDQHTPASLDGLYDDLDRYAEVLGEMNDNAVRAAKDLAAARATNQRLNLRAQALESELAAYRRAAADWEITDNSTYVPLRTLAAIAKAAGLEVPERWELHYQRVERAEAELRRYTEADSADAAAGSYAMRAETAERERDEARQHSAAIAAQRDRLRMRMNALADRWDHALAPDKAYARTLRAEIGVAPFEPEASLAVQPYRADDGSQRWAARCWGTETCDGWLSLGHDTERWAEVARDRHVAEDHAAPVPAATEATDT